MRPERPKSFAFLSLMYEFSLMSISQSTVGKQKEKQPGQQVWPAPQEQTRRLPDCVCGVSPEREIESEAPSPGLVEQMQPTWCPKHESIQVSGPWRVSQRRSSCFFKFAIDWQVATFSEAAVRTEALFLAKTSGHEPHGRAGWSSFWKRSIWCLPPTQWQLDFSPLPACYVPWQGCF